MSTRQKLEVQQAETQTLLIRSDLHGTLPDQRGSLPGYIKGQGSTGNATTRQQKSVERFLGCLQYFSRFLPQLAQVAAPLRQLTEQ